MPQPLLDAWAAIKTYNTLFLLVVIVVLVLLLIRRIDVAPIVPRLKSFQLGPSGLKLELFEDLGKLQDNAVKGAVDVAEKSRGGGGGPEGAIVSSSEVVVAPTPHSRAVPQSAAIAVHDHAELKSHETVPVEEFEPPQLDVIDVILNEAAANPKAALIRLSVAMEDELMRLLGGAGFLAGKTYLPLGTALNILRTQYRALPESVLSALEAFQIVRNKIVHSGEALPDETLSAIESGLIVLRTLRGLPIARYVILHPRVPLYSDEFGAHERLDVHGVIIEEVSAGGLLKTKHVQPTTRAHFKPGMQVAWEWNFDSQWGETWYLDPDTQETKHAWSNSVEFVGRGLDELIQREPLRANSAT
jgi:hypothetical protein